MANAARSASAHVPRYGHGTAARAGRRCGAARARSTSRRRPPQTCAARARQDRQLLPRSSAVSWLQAPRLASAPMLLHERSRSCGRALGLRRLRVPHRIPALAHPEQHSIHARAQTCAPSHACIQHACPAELSRMGVRVGGPRASAPCIACSLGEARSPAARSPGQATIGLPPSREMSHLQCGQQRQRAIHGGQAVPRACQPGQARPCSRAGRGAVGQLPAAARPATAAARPPPCACAPRG